MATPEQNLDYTNVVFIDEYPELAKRSWLKRLDRDRRIGQLALFPKDPGQLLLFPELEGTPDGAA
jgi:hypothetical protein